MSEGTLEERQAEMRARMARERRNKRTAAFAREPEATTVGSVEASKNPQTDSEPIEREIVEAALKRKCAFGKAA